MSIRWFGNIQRLTLQQTFQGCKFGHQQPNELVVRQVIRQVVRQVVCQVVCKVVGQVVRQVERQVERQIVGQAIRQVVRQVIRQVVGYIRHGCSLILTAALFYDGKITRLTRKSWKHSTWKQTNLC